MDHHIQALFYDVHYGNNVVQQVALFDERDIAREEVSRLIRAEQYDSRVIIITQKQYEQVFRSLMNNEENQAAVKKGDGHDVS